MIEALRGWLLTILLLCVFCALGESLMQSGPIKQVGKLVCGLVLLSGILAPMVSVDVESGQRWLEEWMTRWEGETLRLKAEAQGITRSVIEEEYAAYIVDKAKEYGIACVVQVEAQSDEEGDWPLPWFVQVYGTISESDRLWLAGVIEEELGVPAQRQSYDVQEEAP